MPADGFSDIVPDTTPPDTTDVPVETPDGVDVDDPEPDGPGPCTPDFADRARTIFGGLSVSSGDEGDPDLPVLLTLSNDQVWVMGRITASPSASDTPKLTYVRVNPENALPQSDWHHPIGSITLDAVHPTAPLGEEPDETTAMITVFPDVHGVSANQMLYMILGTAPVSGTPAGIVGTGPYSTHPTTASASTQIMTVWRQGNATDSNSSLNFALIDTAGTVTGPGTAAGDSSEDLGHPTLAFNGTGYGLAYFVNAGAGTDRTEFVELDAAGTPVSGSSRSWSVAGDSRAVGRPVLVWNGSGYALMWEEAAGTTGTPHLHLSFVDAGGTGSTDLDLDTALSSVGTLTSGQPGMLNLVWTGARYGVVWVHVNPSTGTHVWFFELDTDGSIADGPHNLNPDATQSFNPAITWIGTSTLRYYVFAWNEFSSATGVHVLYTYTYGCDPTEV